VKVIPANGPQAKGRVEGNHGPDQGRPVKELRLAGIGTIEETNRFPVKKLQLPQKGQISSSAV
jgi:hypothetical protein